MRQIFRTRGTKRKDDLKELLKLETTNHKDFFKVMLQGIRQHYKIILIMIVVAFSFIKNVLYFNSFNVMDQRVTTAMAQIDSALQMRQNLVPALTVIVYQFINHEKNVFLKTVEAREGSAGSRDIENLKKGLQSFSNGAVSTEALSKFIAVAENYPQLVSSQSYQLLISQITDVEKQIYTKRVEYNEEANVYNTALSLFPANMVGRVMGFRMKPYFNWKNASEWVFTSTEKHGELPVSMELRENSKQKTDNKGI